MRRQPIRPSSAHNVCVFCACHLGGDALPPSARGARYIQLRNIQSSRFASQNFGAAVSQATPNNTKQSAEEREREALRRLFSPAPAQPQASRPQASGNGGATQPGPRAPVQPQALHPKVSGNGGATQPGPRAPVQPQALHPKVSGNGGATQLGPSAPAQPQALHPQASGNGGVTRLYSPAPAQPQASRPQASRNEGVIQQYSRAPAQPQASRPQASGDRGAIRSGLSEREARERQALAGFAKRLPPQPTQPQLVQPFARYSNRERTSQSYNDRNREDQLPIQPSRSGFKLRYSSAQRVQPENAGFDEGKISQWQHVKPRGQIQGDTDGNRWPMGHENRQHTGNHQYVAFGSGVRRQDMRFSNFLRTETQRPEAAPRETPATQQPENLSSHVEANPFDGPAETAASEHVLFEKQIVEQQAREKQAAEQQARERRLKKFAIVDETIEEAPRKRKGRGSRSRSSDYDEDYDVDDSRAERKARKKKEKQQRAALKTAAPTPIYVPQYLSVANLATMLRVRTEDLVRKMEELGYEDINHADIINAENAGLISMEYNFEPVAAEGSADQDLHPAPEPEDKSALPPRPPIVTIMGHVDHGKTTLLDYLRKSSVAATEFGGITQHIGAFNVPLSSGKTITFLDTPGHAAFLNMRQRGARVTDIVILVVAADDGVKPQTVEAIKHAKSARVPMIVAVNKIDKEGADMERVKQDLSRHGVDVEDYGGDVQAIAVSGKTGQGMDDLEEATILLSEILDHRANPEGPVEGWILEASTKKSGRAATVLVRRGTLRCGDCIVAGTNFARVRTMKNEAGADIKSVGPGMPAEIDGWRGLPEAGDEVLQAPDEQKAASVVEYRQTIVERQQLAVDMEAINEARRLEQEKREKEAAIAAAIEAGKVDPEEAAGTAKADVDTTPGVTEVPFILKADVSGSVEAVLDYVMTVGNVEVRPRVIRHDVGNVSEFDVEHAAVAGGHVIAFNVSPDPHIAHLAEMKGVQILEQNVIYRLVDDVKAVLSEKLTPLVVQKVTGEATVLQKFSIGLGKRKTMMIAGCRVQNGQVSRGGKVRVLRDDKKVYEGTISSLKQVKKDVSEMRKGSDCGMSFENWQDFQPGDSIQCFEEKSEKRYL